jgi:hypothetical protein
MTKRREKNKPKKQFADTYTVDAQSECEPKPREKNELDATRI